MNKILLALAGTAMIAFFMFIQLGKEPTIEETSEVVNTKKIVKKTSELKTEKKIMKPTAFKIVKAEAKSATTFDIVPNTSEKEIPSKEKMNEDIMNERNKILTTLHPRVIKTLLAIPACLENAETKKDAFRCGDKYREVNVELDFVMGEINEDEKIEGFDENFTWNEETKIAMIKEIEASIAPMEEVHSCIRAANSEREITECFSKKI